MRGRSCRRSRVEGKGRLSRVWHIVQVEQTTRCTLRFTAYLGCGQRPAHTLGPANASYNTTGQEERGAEEPLETKGCRARGLGCILSTRPSGFT